MSKLSKNFSTDEFVCHCGYCDYSIVSHELIDVLQDVRDHFDTTVSILSGIRCKEHNTEVGGAKRSQHLLGTAADITVKGVSHLLVQEYLLSLYPDKYGIGKYKSFTHVDVRKNRARW